MPVPILENADLAPEVLREYARERTTIQIGESIANDPRFMPAALTESLEYEVRGTITRTAMAEYRAFGAENRIGTLPGVSKQRDELAPLGKRLVITEREMIKLASLNDPARAAVDMVYTQLNALVESAIQRAERDRMQVLSTGKWTVAENGYIKEVDYGVPSGHKPSVGTVWSTAASATPLANLRAWGEIYFATNRFYPGAWCMSTPLLNELLATAEVKAAIQQRGITQGGVVGKNDLDQALNILGLPPIEVYDETSNVSGTETRNLADDIVFAVPPANRGGAGRLLFGPTAAASAALMSGAVTAEEVPGIWVSQWVEQSNKTWIADVDATIAPAAHAGNELFIVDAS